LSFGGQAAVKRIRRTRGGGGKKVTTKDLYYAAKEGRKVFGRKKGDCTVLEKGEGELQSLLSPMNGGGESHLIVGLPNASRMEGGVGINGLKPKYGAAGGQGGGPRVQRSRILESKPGREERLGKKKPSKNNEQKEEKRNEKKGGKLSCPVGGG